MVVKILEYLIAVYFFNASILDLCGSLWQLFSCIGLFYILSYWKLITKKQQIFFDPSGKISWRESESF